MKGSVEIYQSYNNEDKLLFSGDNMIVDGGRELIATMMAHRNQVSASPLTYATTGSDAVSSFQINAIAFGPARDYFPETLSRWSHSVSGYGGKFGNDVLSGHGNFASGTAGWHANAATNAQFYPIGAPRYVHMSGAAGESKYVTLKEDFPDGLYKANYTLSTHGTSGAILRFSERQFDAPHQMSSVSVDGRNEVIFRHIRSHGEESPAGAGYNKKIQISLPEVHASEIFLSSLTIRKMDDDRHCLLPMRDRDFFEVANPPRGVGPNQWEYLEDLQAGAKPGPNILLDSTLTNNNEDWVINDRGGVERTEEASTNADGSKVFNRFTYKKHPGHYTMRQQIPMNLGTEYTFKINGRSTGVPLGVKVYRGVDQEKRQLLDFDTGEWVSVLSKPGTKDTFSEDLLNQRGQFDHQVDFYDTGIQGNNEPYESRSSNVSGYYHVSAAANVINYSYTTSATYSTSRLLNGFPIRGGRTYKAEFDIFDYHNLEAVNAGMIAILTDRYDDRASGFESATYKVHPGRNIIYFTPKKDGVGSPENGAHKARGCFAIGKQKSTIANFKLKNLTVKEVTGKRAAPYTNQEILLKNVTHDSHAFRFKLEGYKKDQSRKSYKKYWLELDIPNSGYFNSTWNPMTSKQDTDKYIDIFDIALYDHDKQILKNPNFNNRTTEIIDGEFKTWVNFTEDSQSIGVLNPDECTMAGLASPGYWNAISPRSTQEFPLAATGHGAVKRFTPLTTQGTNASGYSEGVVLTTSSTSGTHTGFAEINQTVYLDNKYSNWLVGSETDTSDPARIETLVTELGVKNMNGTAMLTFDYLANPVGASGLGEAALSIELERIRDGQRYCFSPNSEGKDWKMWSPAGVNASAIPLDYMAYPQKGYPFLGYHPRTPNTWHRFCANVEFDDALAGEEAYKITIRGGGTGDLQHGHSLATGPVNTFVDYFIKNLSFGRLQGWDIYTYGADNPGTSGVYATVSLVPSGQAQEGRFMNRYPTSQRSLPYEFNGQRDVLLVSSQGGMTDRSEYNTDDYLDFGKTGRTEISQRFKGLQPRKKYQLAVKASPQSSYVTAYYAYLKAYRGGSNRKTGFNLLRLEGLASGESASMCEYGKGTAGAVLKPYPPAADPRIKADQTSLRVDTSLRHTFYANAGTRYSLEIESFRESSEKGYLILSSVPTAGDPTYFWNWQSLTWQTPGVASVQYGDPEWYLPFAGHNSDSFHTDYHRQASGEAVSPTITFYPNTLGATKSTALTTDGLGRNGEYTIAATVFASNPASPVNPNNEPIYLKKFKLLGQAEDAAKSSQVAKWYNFATQSWQATKAGTHIGGNNFPEGSDAGFHSSSVDVIPTICNMHEVGFTEDTIYSLHLVDVSGGPCLIHEVSLTDIALGLNDNLNPDAYRADRFTSESEKDLLGNLGVWLKERSPGAYVWLDSANTLDGTIHDGSRTPSGVFCAGVIPRKGATAHSDSSATPAFPTVNDPDIGRYDENLPYAVIGAHIPDKKVSKKSRSSLPLLTFHDKIGNLGLDVGDKLAFGIDAVQAYGESLTDVLPNFGGDTDTISNNLPVDFFAGVVTEGRTYFYDWDSAHWIEAQTPFMASADAGLFAMNHSNSVSAYSHVLTPKIKVPPFSKDSDFIIGVAAKGIHPAVGTMQPTQTHLRTLKRYRVTEAGDWYTKHLHPGGGIASGVDYRVSSHIYFPEFPTPLDKTLQTLSPGAGELGHYMNRAQWFNTGPGNGVSDSAQVSAGAYIRNHVMRPSKTGERDWEEAVLKGAYIPSVGAYVPPWATLTPRTFGTDNSAGLGYVSGVLNMHQSVNSDGYIYKVPGNHSSHTYGDASAGLAVSSVRDTTIAGGQVGTARAGAKELRYMMRMTRDQWRVMEDVYGGIGTMGLYGINWNDTIAKNGAGPFLDASSTHTGIQNAITPLYNLSRPEQNPKFQLFSKKVMFPPGLHINYDNTDYITIIWKVKL